MSYTRKRIQQEVKNYLKNASKTELERLAGRPAAEALHRDGEFYPEAVVEVVQTGSAAVFGRKYLKGIDAGEALKPAIVDRSITTRRPPYIPVTPVLNEDGEVMTDPSGATLYKDASEGYFSGIMASLGADPFLAVTEIRHRRDIAQHVGAAAFEIEVVVDPDDLKPEEEHLGVPGFRLICALDADVSAHSLDPVPINPIAPN